MPVELDNNRKYIVTDTYNYALFIITERLNVIDQLSIQSYYYCNPNLVKRNNEYWCQTPPLSAFDIFNKLKCFKKLNLDINQKFIELEHTCVCLKNVLGIA